MLFAFVLNRSSSSQSDELSEALKKEEYHSSSAIDSSSVQRLGPGSNSPVESLGIPTSDLATTTNNALQ